MNQDQNGRRSSAADPAGGGGRIRPIFKQAAFALVTVAGFFALLEFILALAGVRPVLDDEDPLLVFSGYTPLFVEDRQEDGSVIMKTAEEKLRLFNYQEFPRDKDDNTYRVFCVGGSTTYGHPYRDGQSFCGWLRAWLDVAEPERDWEVINAGGISYASYRVARLMNELVQYQPDLFIVYTGQNEFLEERSYGRLVDLPYWMLRTDAALSGTRTYTALRRAIESIQSGTEGTFRTRDTLSDEADEVLRHTVGPTSYHRDDELRTQILRHFRINLDRMARIASAAGAEIFFVHPVVNLKDMSPFKSEHREDLGDAEKIEWEMLFQQASERLAAGEPANALVFYRRAAEIDDRHAELHYRTGRALFELGRYEEAEQAFWRAVDEDVAPLRMVSPMPDILREVAKRHQAPLIDFPEILRRHYRTEYGHAVFGREYFLGHVHMDIKAYRLISLSLLEQMIERGLVAPSPGWGEETIAKVTETVLSGLDLWTHGEALLTLAKTLDWAGKFEEAHHVISLQLELIGPNAPGYQLLGRHADRRGDPAAALPYYLKAIELDPGTTHVHSYIADIYAEQGRTADAIRHYREYLKAEPSDYSVHDRLAAQLAIEGELEAADRHLREVLRHKPDHEPAMLNRLFLLAEQQKYGEALSYGSEMLRSHPDSDQLHNRLGVIHARLGEFEHAIEHFSQALRLNPDSESAREHLRRAREHLRED